MKQKLKEELSNIKFDIDEHFKQKDAWPLDLGHYQSYLVQRVTGIDFFAELMRILLPKYKIILQEKQFMLVPSGDKHESNIVIQSSKGKRRVRASSKSSKSSKRSK